MIAIETLFGGQGPLVINGYNAINGPGAGWLTVTTNAENSPLLLVNGHFNTNSGITFSGGEGHSGEGGALFLNSSLTMGDCVVTGNSAERGGDFILGGIGNLELINSEVIGKTAEKRGAIYSWGGMVSLKNSSVPATLRPSTAEEYFRNDNKERRPGRGAVLRRSWSS